MNAVGADLRDMLAAGWEIVGFQSSITQLERASETDGYVILLKRGPDVAMCTVMYDDTGLAPQRIYYLTGERE